MYNFLIGFFPDTETRNPMPKTDKQSDMMNFNTPENKMAARVGDLKT